MSGFSAAPLGLGSFFEPLYQGMNPLADICRPVGAGFRMTIPLDEAKVNEISPMPALKGRRSIARG